MAASTLAKILKQPGISIRYTRTLTTEKGLPVDGNRMVDGPTSILPVCFPQHTKGKQAHFSNNKQDWFVLKLSGSPANQNKLSENSVTTLSRQEYSFILLALLKT